MSKKLWVVQRTQIEPVWAESRQEALRIENGETGDSIWEYCDAYEVDAREMSPHQACGEFLDCLPWGEDTPVSPDGVELSCDRIMSGKGETDESEAVYEG